MLCTKVDFHFMRAPKGDLLFVRISNIESEGLQD